MEETDPVMAAAHKELPSALANLSRVERHWFSQSRRVASRLRDLVAAEGCRVTLHELPPDWEHVIVRGETSYDELAEIAAQRSRLRDDGTAPNDLPG